MLLLFEDNVCCGLRDDVEAAECHRRLMLDDTAMHLRVTIGMHDE